MVMAKPAPAQSLQLAIQHFEAGRVAEAEQIGRQFLARQPRSVEALHLLSVISLQAGRLSQAEELTRKAVGLNPAHAAIHSNHGEACRRLGRLDEAIASFQRALKLQPDHVDALNNLGVALTSLGRCDEATSALRRALFLRPDFARAHYNLGVALTAQGHPTEAIESFQQAVALQPDFAEALSNLGNLLNEQGQFDRARECLQRAVRANPALAEAHNNLGNLCKDAGLLDVLAAELHRWRERHERPLASAIRRHENDRSPERPLRIGYVSSDFRQHAVAFFLLPLLQAHDRSACHITGYATTARTDDVTARLRAGTDAWCDLSNLNDEEAAQRIRHDRIDILVDLSGHTAGNRLPLFARKPAPVQVSYLGFPGLTGLETIDYFVSDPWADPPDRAEHSASTSPRIWRLPDSAWCFEPILGQPPIGELPAKRTGHVTFGCFNNVAKITDEMIRCWAEVLERTPQSRLVLKNLSVGSLGVVPRLQATFGSHGIAAQRVGFIRPQASHFAHLACYDHVDLALDTFPYHGTTTTCESLSMGVPVVTLAGDRHLSRVGVSLLNSVGLPEFVAPNVAGYVEAAINAARDPVRLATLRADLRGRMEGSPLMNAPRLARNIESAFRAMWQRWCAQPASTTT
jgi:protein O-GlcNAc transferase